MEKGKKLLVIDDDEIFASGLAAYARRCGKFTDAVYAADGEEGIKTAALIGPDVIVLDAIMPRLDGLGFLRKLKVSGMKKPVIIMNSRSQLSHLFDTASEYGIDYFMIKPQAYHSICDTAYDLLCGTVRIKPAPRKEDAENAELERSVTVFLRNLGVPAHLDGYRYLRLAILMTINDASLISPITKRLYPRIADVFSTNKCCVERAIRHAICVSWQRGNKKLLGGIFGISPDDAAARRPTNSEYIAMAADDLRLKLKHGLFTA